MWYKSNRVGGLKNILKILQKTCFWLGPPAQLDGWDPKWGIASMTRRPLPADLARILHASKNHANLPTRRSGTHLASKQEPCQSGQTSRLAHILLIATTVPTWPSRQCGMHLASKQGPCQRGAAAKLVSANLAVRPSKNHASLGLSPVCQFGNIVVRTRAR